MSGRPGTASTGKVANPAARFAFEPLERLFPQGQQALDQHGEHLPIEFGQGLQKAVPSRHLARIRNMAPLPGFYVRHTLDGHGFQ
jgi:hypothetical protein